MTQRVISATLATAIGACLLSMVPTGGALGPAPVFAEPQVSQATPQDGAVVDVLPESLNLCFSEAVKAEGQDAWRFAVKPPGGQPLGLRVVFAPDGGCVEVFPGAPSPPPEGIWQFDWLVSAQSDGSQASGTIHFQLGALQRGETPLPAPRVSSDDGSDPPILLFVLIGVGALVGVIGVVGLLVRRRRV
jgi:methionine-rich copper-binding protein CopC